MAATDERSIPRTKAHQNMNQHASLYLPNKRRTCSERVHYLEKKKGPLHALKLKQQPPYVNQHRQHFELPGWWCMTLTSTGPVNCLVSACQ